MKNDVVRVSTGSKPLDNLLNGGIEADCITEVYGEGGCGKTTLCLLLSKTVALSGKRVMYIDTEGVSLERLRQISGDEFDNVLRNIVFSRPYSLEMQAKVINDCVRVVEAEGGDVGLVVVDSATIHYRLEFTEESRIEDVHALYSQMVSLQGIARKHKIPVVVTAHVYMDTSANRLRPIAEYVIGRLAKTILLIERVEGSKRKAVIVKHRSLPEGRYVEFNITHSGFE